MTEEQKPYGKDEAVARLMLDEAYTKILWAQALVTKAIDLLEPKKRRGRPPKDKS